MSSLAARQVSPPARQALRAAHDLRRKLQIEPTSPVDPFLVAEKIGIEVRLVNVPKLDGLFLRYPKRTILLSSLRPLSRLPFTCAHEIGHDVLGHNPSHALLVDGVSTLSSSDSAEEKQAEFFGGILLMPPLAIHKALREHELTPQHADPVSLYQLACAFGVGYTTLVTHLTFALGLITPERRLHLLRTKLPSIRQQLTGQAVAERLIPVNHLMHGRPIDVEVGDMLFSTVGISVEVDLLDAPIQVPNGLLYRVARQGIGQVRIGSWANFLRASLPGYTGRAIFRHLKDDDDA